MKSEAISIDTYFQYESEQQFEYIYENYSVMEQVLLNYRTELIKEIMEQKAYNRRVDDSELGIRVKVSRNISSPVEREIINKVSIGKAIDEGILDEEFFRDTDDRQELIRKVAAYHMVSEEFSFFTDKLKTLLPKDRRILGPYLMGTKTITDLAEDMGVDYGSAVKKIYRLKKKLIELVNTKRNQDRRVRIEVISNG